MITCNTLHIYHTSTQLSYGYIPLDFVTVCDFYNCCWLFVGKCLHNKDLPLELVNPVENMFDDAFKNLIAKYKFVISFENGRLLIVCLKN